MKNKGVFNVRKELVAKSDAKASQDPLSVPEDNYVKYFLHSKCADESDTDNDDDFGSIEGDELADFDENASSVESAATLDEANDTSKNNHFYVWRSRSKKATRSALRHDESEPIGSENESTGEVSDGSATSSDEFEEETEYEDEEDYDLNEENPALHNQPAPTAAKLTHEEDHDIFFTETIEILKRGLKENLNPDNLILEINSCKHANNIQIDDLCYYLAKAVLNLPLVLHNSASVKPVGPFDYLTVIRTQLKRSFALVLENFYTNTKQSQKILLNAMLDFFLESKAIKLGNEAAVVLNLLDVAFVKLMHYMYNELELLSEVLVKEWYEEKLVKAAADVEVMAALKKLEPFIKWLEESDDDDDDEEDDD